ncbi:MAG: polysaccharide deacetylase family protein, partial [Akkermansia sp.]|nr:polysaccharide deacetylase family protein [Akkermansia sp.]
LNFIGNIEAKEAVKGGCDVIVCDGFSGNVMLKTIEGVGSFAGTALKGIFKKNIITKIAALLVMPGLNAFKAMLDPNKVGGTAFIGVSKPVLKAYGYPFTMYLYTRYINVKGDSMTSEQIQEMMAHGATIGSHSSNHLYPSKWKRYKQDSAEYAAQLQKELVDSRTKLMSMFGNCSTYCYPGGYNTPPMHEVLGTAGYQAAFTVLEKKVQCEEVQFQVHRYMVFGTNHEIFRRAVNFGGQENVAATRAAITAAEKPAREFFPSAFEGCTNMTVFAPPSPKKPAAKKTAVKKTAAKSKAKTTPKAAPVPEAEPSPAPAAEPIPVGKLP